MPKRIQLKRVKGWRMPEGTVKVTRPGPWGNPFCVEEGRTAETCVELFKFLCAGWFFDGTGDECLKRQLAFSKHLKAHIHELRGKNLACWCKPGAPCHADVLLQLANKKC